MPLVAISKPTAAPVTNSAPLLGPKLLIVALIGQRQSLINDRSIVDVRSKTEHVVDIKKTYICKSVASEDNMMCENVNMNHTLLEILMLLCYISPPEGSPVPLFLNSTALTSDL